MDGSRDILEKILQNEPSRETLFIVLEKLKKEGRWNEVIRACGRFSKICHDDIRMKTVLAEAYEKVGFLGLAEKELSESVSIVESMVPVHKKLAAIYERQGRHEEAVLHIRRYLAYYPDDPDALTLLEKILSSIHMAPVGDNAGAFFDDLATPTIAEIYFDQGQLEAAVSVYEKVIVKNPQDEKSLVRLRKLKALVESEENHTLQEKKAVHRKEKMIEILERWLPRIKEIEHAGSR